MPADFNRIPEIKDVIAASERLAGVVTKTPLLESPLLNELAGRRVLVKAECLQITGAFKFRGAWSAVSSLTDAEKANGVLAFSSGNHAQAVAYAAARHNIKSTIIMPEDAPALKLENTRRYGAEVITYDRAGGEDREAIGQALANERGCVLIKPYDNTQVIAGQGTCGLEIAEQAALRDITNAQVLVCCGGGGLTSGIALALADKAPGLTVHPVEPEHYDDVVRSLISNQRETVNTSETSICDAIVTPSPGELTFPVLQQHCGAGMTVTDNEALEAIKVAAGTLKLVAEPGGAVALAAALFRKEQLQTDTVICVVSGGNVDPAMHARACAL
jgi:threonine dehydratase